MSDTCRKCCGRMERKGPEQVCYGCLEKELAALRQDNEEWKQAVLMLNKELGIEVGEEPDLLGVLVKFKALEKENERLETEKALAQNLVCQNGLKVLEVSRQAAGLALCLSDYVKIYKEKSPLRNASEEALAAYRDGQKEKDR